MMNDYMALANALNDMFYKDEYKGFPIDIIEGDNQYTVVAEIPGVKKEDIQLSFENGVLHMEAIKNMDKNQKFLIHERNAMKMKRDIEFGDIEEESLTAKYENGLLYVTIQLAPKKAKKLIEIC